MFSRGPPACGCLSSLQVAIEGFTKVKGYNSSAVYTVTSSAASYSRPVYLVDLHGDTRYAAGYACGWAIEHDFLTFHTNAMFYVLCLTLLPPPSHTTTTAAAAATLCSQDGMMLGAEAAEVYSIFIGSLIGTSVADKALEAVLGEALDWQWRDDLGVQLPKDFHDEIRGIDDAVGHPPPPPPPRARAHTHTPCARSPVSLFLRFVHTHP